MNMLIPMQASLVADNVYNPCPLTSIWSGWPNVAIRSLMHKDTNNYHAGERGQMEKLWAIELAAGKNVHVKIKSTYTDGSLRASEFTATETIGGNTAKHTIINPAGH